VVFRVAEQQIVLEFVRSVAMNAQRIHHHVVGGNSMKLNRRTPPHIGPAFALDVQFLALYLEASSAVS